MQGCRFGLERTNSRYSTPNNMKGRKISASDMGRTMRLKLKVIDEIRTARSEMEMYTARKDNEEDVETYGGQIFKPHHSRVLRGRYSEHRGQSFDRSLLHINPKLKEEPKKQQRTRPYFQSPNLGEKMNFYLNSLLYKSQEQQKEKMRSNQQKIIEDAPLRKTSYNTRNLFWKKMKRFVSQRKQKQRQEQNALLPLANSFQLHLD